MRYCHKGLSALVNRPFWYTEHTVIIGDEWHLTYSDVKGMLGWQCNSGKNIQKVLYTAQSVGGARENLEMSSNPTLLSLNTV